MSFIVHPAPRMTTAPTPKRPSIENNGPGGNSACAAARVMLHATKSKPGRRLECWGKGKDHMASREARNRRGRGDGLGRRKALLRREGRRLFWLRGGDGVLGRWFLNAVFGSSSGEKVLLRTAVNDGFS